MTLIEQMILTKEERKMVGVVDIDQQSFLSLSFFKVMSRRSKKFKTTKSPRNVEQHRSKNEKSFVSTPNRSHIENKSLANENLSTKKKLASHPIRKESLASLADRIRRKPKLKPLLHGIYVVNFHSTNNLRAAIEEEEEEQ
ncbi:hypothetical protein DICVIV_07545 [Dictyocaulus viviparus]|uniref:Uncharacterized protein n=1 Tax=Dictyocaulus viviparus TaxID=29172 RepID=A0A0D8XRJ3_DICVI|nr:hypothetical protein DICVIV_07545 [Dictyocaulus viviparus]